MHTFYSSKDHGDPLLHARLLVYVIEIGPRGNGYEK
jgi:hypothetical protein